MPKPWIVFDDEELTPTQKLVYIRSFNGYFYSKDGRFFISLRMGAAL